MHCNSLKWAKIFGNLKPYIYIYTYRGDGHTVDDWNPVPVDRTHWISWFCRVSSMPADAGFQPSTVRNDLTYVLDAMVEYVNLCSWPTFVRCAIQLYPTRWEDIIAEHSPPKWKEKSSFKTLCLGMSSQQKNASFWMLKSSIHQIFSPHPSGQFKANQPIQDALEGFSAAEGMTPLLCAVFAEDVEMVRVLVRKSPPKGRKGSVGGKGSKPGPFGRLEYDGMHRKLVNVHDSKSKFQITS